MSLAQINPFDYFSDTNGDPLDQGYIYVGKPNQDPMVNPIAIYYDAAMTIPAPQPLRTVAGYISNPIAPQTFFTNENYSVSVQDKNNVVLFYVANFSSIVSNTPFALQLAASNAWIAAFQADNEAWATAFQASNNAWSTNFQQTNEAWAASFQANMILRYYSFNNRGNWATSTAYGIQDIVIYSNIGYICLVAHTSGTFATDLANGDWAVYQGATKSDLAANTGSSLIGFLQSGMGAIAQTSQTKMRQIVNIKDFGAIGDGTVHYLSERYANLAAAQVDYPFATSITTNTIDWAALQAAINYAAGGIATVHIPKGTFVLNGARQGTQICMINIVSNLTITGSGYNSRLKIADNYTAGGDYRFMASSSGANVDYFSISGVHFDGNGANNLVIDSGANVRRAYSLNILAGINPTVTDCFFSNIPGRNVINFGNNSNPPSISNARITGNVFYNVGGAIPGNQNQNDHSSIYCQSSLGLVAFNRFNNDASFNPLGSPAFACVALEIHGNTTDVIGNIVNNYGTGGNLVASVHDSFDNRWINNKFLNMVSNVLTLWTANNFRNQRLTIRGNLITVNNTTFVGGIAIFQNTQTGVTSRQIEDICIEDNTICFLSEVSKSDTTHGIQLTAVDGGIIRRNKFYNCQGDGIILTEAIATLDIYNVDISDNEFDHYGIHSSLTRIWGIYIANTDVNKVFSNIRINRNKFLRRLPTSVGATPFPTRGIRILGGGSLQDIVVAGDNIFNNIDRTNRIEFVTTTNNKNVTLAPHIISNKKTSLPIRGLFDVNRESVWYTDYIAGESVGLITTTGGACSEATWAATTAYTVGQWIKLSTNKVLVCVVAGTSSSTEPVPTTLGMTLTDGTVTWVYRDSASAVLTPYGASYLVGTLAYTPSSLANGASIAVDVPVTAALLGDIATGAYSASLQGLSISASMKINGTATVVFTNNTGGSITLASGTIYVRVTKQ